MKTSDFDFHLPEELIAQTPVEPRDSSRLLVLDRERQTVNHKIFHDLPGLLKAGDLLVLNHTRVLPARLIGVKQETEAKIELLLLRREERDVWEVLIKPAKRLKIGNKVLFGEGMLAAEVIEVLPDGNRKVRFQYEGVFEELLDCLGRMPLPPYIREQLEDQERYQTVYAKESGSAAAPTAGLHFTPELLAKLQERGVETAEILLHVGLGTFRPVKAERIEEHVMHSEYYRVLPEAAEQINRAKAEKRRVIAVGTTVTRTLESIADAEGLVRAGEGWTDIFIYPPYRFKAVDALITNFHFPKSTLVMLVSAFAGREFLLQAYETAVRERYRFYSFGDSMLII
ncbi:tRNA preQ1(34) S-adenosylmethionine ribosyltransferase-isomerase QueA [Paradesulfitobacterium ferrireducens]|uniref:tRNA preQ1(34) S-adenosylmethionine ribosyltransferase-isomerase QueA n=1 Tax=Paradesulfitobacterium ferrireducens TaxID=2816476 RepID=UPI001A8DFFF9|nr:tRNA preQ1(34) S-adenosylmethionine ribosyltransferase-isomerase QueA [Paradesulfitobacterium ferrireducens]